MNGKLFYLSMAALLGALFAHQRTMLILFVFLLYFFCLIHFKKNSKVFFFCIFFFFALYALTTQYKINSNTTKLSASDTTFRIVIIGDVTFDGDRMKAIVKSIKHDEKMLMVLKLNSEAEKIQLKQQLKIGSIYEIQAALNKPPIAKNPNSFQYDSYLKRNSIHWLAEIQKMHFIAEINNRNNPILYLRQYREKELSSIEKNFSSTISSITAAMIFGDRSLFMPEVIESYQKIGIIHLLAISGLHVALLAGMIYYLGIRVGITREWMRKVLYVFLPVYAVLAGASPSVNRAVVMLICMMIFSERRGPIQLGAIDALGFSFLLLLLWDVYVIYDIGFQLSYSVTLGLILSVPIILKTVQNKISTLFITSYIAQVCSLPFLLYYFFKISILGLVVNLLYIPIYSFVFMPAAFIFYFFQKLFGGIPLMINNGMSAVVAYSNNFAIALSQIPGFEIITGRLDSSLSFILVIIILYVQVVWEVAKSRKQIVILLLLPWLFILLQRLPPYFDSSGEVTFIDVGQGDCVLIRLPYKKGVYLIDTGGVLTFAKEDWQMRVKNFEVGRDVVVPFLHSKGISEIDKLILTHGDADHIGGAEGVLNGVKVNEIVFPDVLEHTQSEKNIAKIAMQKGISIVTVAKGDSWKVGEYIFQVLNPIDDFQGGTNEGSIVLYVKLGNLNWLFTGDLEEGGEQKVLESYPDLDIDVLKVGHHGSRSSTSEAFLEKTTPRIALISVGANNSFGHPHQDVLARLKNKGMRIYRTDNDGAITYLFSGKKGTISTYIP